MEKIDECGNISFFTIQESCKKKRKKSFIEHELTSYDDTLLY